MFWRRTSRVRNLEIIKAHLKRLSYGYPLFVDDGFRFFVARRCRLPPGFNVSTTDVLVYIPEDYPATPPGVTKSGRVYVPPGLRFRGRRLRDVHEDVNPPDGTDFGWLCYEWVKWDPCKDDFVKFLEMVRADLTNPPTK